jgi:uncharacterized MAPEG superfamily protein
VVEVATELQILGYAALLQYLQFLLMAVPVNLQLGVRYTAGSRDSQQQPTGIAGRLYRAMNNHTENLVLFTVAVLVVVLGDASSSGTIAAAWTYLIARILYVPAYASGVYLLRSLIFSVGFAATLYMLISALF